MKPMIWPSRGPVIMSYEQNIKGIAVDFVGYLTIFMT